MIGVTAIRTRFPTLIDFDDGDAVGVLMETIQDAELDLSESVWGDLYERGAALLVAHRTTLKQRAADGEQGGAFPVSQASADGLTQQFATPTDIAPQLAHYYTTSYGAEFMELSRRVAGGIHLVA